MKPFGLVLMLLGAGGVLVSWTADDPLGVVTLGRLVVWCSLFLAGSVFIGCGQVADALNDDGDDEESEDDEPAEAPPQPKRKKTEAKG
jgi:hypothetical protein